ncbi:carboxymuconolactone decarboxylase family protein [Flavobacterium phycosphaerae]|uniref:carboxymuconolactone decarboxylase family protein n=1 Tax=Flavobacterium phycosphaerae TaxID=2697515 RepID=UPI001389A3D6|nr:carboxymuconolactone decarboxylase family protein [Flavobacterium phycosphaerae]
MTRLQALNPETTTGKTKELFNAVQSKLGIVPNMMRTMGNSDAVLEGYLNLSGALSKGKLNNRTGELIALAVAESNNCLYCTAAHTFIGENLLKTDLSVLEAARSGESADSKTKAILKLAKTLVSKNGQVNDEDVTTAKNAGITDGEIAEVVAHVALNILTNYFNNTANTEVDFPAVATL